MFDVLFDKTLLRNLGGFSIIGVINTAIHLTVVMFLVECLNYHSVAANCLAFVTANIFSFYVNSRWNYRIPMERSRYWRFFVVSIAGLVITAAVSATAQKLGWHYLMGTGAIFVVLPAFTFAAHHWWTWGKEADKAGKTSH